MTNGWHDISEIEEFREYYEFNSYAVLVNDKDEDGDNYYRDIAFGVNQIPKGTIRFYVIFDDEQEFDDLI